MRAQGIADGGVGIVRWAHGLSNYGGGVGRGKGIYDAYEGSETTVEAARAQQWSQGIYYNYRGVGG